MKKTFRHLNKIVPEKAKKEAFRKILLAKINETEERSAFAYFFGRVFQKAAFASFVAIAVVLSGFSGAVYASANSLPGDTLYNVKLFTEKTQVALAQDNVKRSELYLEFAEKRLLEIKELQEKGSPSKDVLNEALKIYRSQISKSKETLANASTKDLKNVANIIDERTKNNRAIIEDIAKDTNKESQDILEEAYEKTSESNEDANLVLFEIATSAIQNNSTSTPSKENIDPKEANDKKDNEQKNENEDIDDEDNKETKEKDQQTQKNTIEPEAKITIPENLIKKAVSKIEETERKITETRKYLDEISNRHDTKEAQDALDGSEKMIKEAKELIEQDKYYDSFKISIDAYRKAHQSKKMIKEQEDEKEDKKERTDTEKETRRKIDIKTEIKISDNEEHETNVQKIVPNN